MTALGFKYFHSRQVGAPVLTGEVGKLIAVLDWALETSDSTNGFEKVYAATNKAVYRSRYGLRPYLDVDDSASMAGGARDAGVRAYESMTGIGTGTSPFPLPATIPVLAWRKSQAASAVVRRYCGIKTAQMLLLYVNTDGEPDGHCYFFGQLPAKHPNENYPALIAAATISASGTLSTANYGLGGLMPTQESWGGGSVSAVSAGIYWQRNPAGSIKAVSGNMRRSASAGTYSIADGSEIALVRAEVMHTDVNTSASQGARPRTYIPNLWTTAADLATAGWSPGDTFTVPDYDPSAVFMYAGRGYHHLIFEITDTGGAV